MDDVSKEITRLRRAGDLEGSYKLAVAAIAEQPDDIWLHRNYGWTLIKLIQECFKSGDTARFKKLSKELRELSVPETDELLAQQKARVLNLGREDSRALARALDLAKAKQYREAAGLFRTLQKEKYPFSDYERGRFGWALYQENQELLGSTRDSKPAPQALRSIKINLMSYLDLGIGSLVEKVRSDKDSLLGMSSYKRHVQKNRKFIDDSVELLHRLILVQAHRLAEQDSLNLCVFLKLWKPEYFSREDFLPSRSGEREYPPLAKTVIRHCAKEILSSKTQTKKEDLHFVLPLIEDLLTREPDDIWLQYDQIRLLKEDGQVSDALAMCREFVRKKPQESWAWSLLAELVEDEALKLSCYAKALTCPQEDAFLGQIRLSFAKLAAEQYPEQARFEIETLLKAKTTGKALRREAETLSKASWFQESSASPPSPDFYESLAAAADDEVLSNIPWERGVVGERFSVGGKEEQKKKKRQKILIEDIPIPSEISVALQLVPKDFRKPGTPVWVRAERPSGSPPILHGLKARNDAEDFDIVPELIGVVDHVNVKKQIFHFIVAREIDAIHLLEGVFKNIKEGDFIAARLGRYHSRNGARVGVLSIRASHEQPDPQVFQEFHSRVERVAEAGFAFSDDGMFISPQLSKAAQLVGGEEISGTAVLNFDRKKSTWGWKVLSLEVLERPSSDIAG